MNNTRDRIEFVCMVGGFVCVCVCALCFVAATRTSPSERLFYFSQSNNNGIECQTGVAGEAGWFCCPLAWEPRSRTKFVRITLMTVAVKNADGNWAEAISQRCGGRAGRSPSSLQSHQHLCRPEQTRQNVCSFPAEINVDEFNLI